jgi:hypothetical protein
MTSRFPYFVAAGALVAASSAVAYIVGYNGGKSAMDHFCGVVIRGSSAGLHVSLFAKHAAAISDISSGSLADADRTLRLLRYQDSDTITQCLSDPSCREVMGQRPPDASALRDSLQNDPSKQPNNRLERSRDASSVSQGGNR